MLDPQLEAAYRRSVYWVAWPTSYIAIRIGQMSAEIDDQLQRLGYEDWAVITANNPCSRLLTPSENQSRNAELYSILRSLNCEIVPAWGVGHDGAWPPEESFWVSGLSREQVQTVARRFEQAAIVYGRIAEPAQLVAIDSDASR